MSTDRTRLQRQHTATAALHQAMLERATDPVLVLDRFGIVQTASWSVESMFGWAPSELVGKNVSVLMTEPHRGKHDGYLERYLATGHSAVLGRMREFIVRRRDGALITCELSAFRIDVPGEEHPLFCGFFRDISERKRVQAQEAAHLAALGTIAEHASVLAHEIKNPITGLSHALRALAGKLGADEKEIIGELVARMQRLERRMRRTLAFVRSPELKPERSDLRQLARDVVNDMRPLWEAKRARVEVVAPAPCEAEVDAPLLYSVLTNLLGNALDAIEQGGRIEVLVRHVDRHMRIEVEDDGPGIAPSIRETLFQPFVTSKVEGTGLGLMICKRIVEAHQGSIAVEEGRLPGARFVVTIPSSRDHARLSPG